MAYRQLILKNLRLSVMANSAAFAYSTTITGTYTLLSSDASPTPLDVFAGAAGAVVAFMVAEGLALLFLSDQPDNDSTSTRLLGRMLNLFSVGCALGSAYLIGLWHAGPARWFLATLVASLVFVVLEGLELAVAEAREEEGGGNG